MTENSEFDAAGRTRRGRRRQEPQDAPPPPQPIPSLIPGFLPTTEQIQLKAVFYSAAEDLLLSSEHIDEAFIAQHCPAVVRNRLLQLWNTDVSFRDWLKLSPALENAAKVEWLYNQALTTTMAILADTDPKSASARVNAVKLVAELGKKTASKQLKQDDSSLAALIGKMDVAQLMATVQAGGNSLTLAAKTAKVATRAPETLPQAEVQDAEEIPPQEHNKNQEE